MPDTPLNPDALAHAQSAAFDCWESGGNMDDLTACAIEAYLAVAQPEVNSVEELAALPINSLVLDRFDYPHHKCAQSKPDFTNLRTGHFISRGEFYFPARVLYRPEVKP